MTGIIDVVMVSSLGKIGSINEEIKNYGLVLMDECHHSDSDAAEAVIREATAKYVYGLTATPKRDDGQEQKVFMQIGPKAESYPRERIKITQDMIRDLMAAGVIVCKLSAMHEHFAIIDKEIVWYGSVNLLSDAKK